MKEGSQEVFDARYKALNTAQKQAVDTTDGPVLVIAGPGSGKTELVAIRIANIINLGRARPEYILALTFTDSACTNMRERLLKIMGRDAYRVPIFTFHSFCTHIINTYPEHFFEAHRFEAVSPLVQNEILSTIFSNLRFGHPLFGYHEERGYTYFSDTLERIKNFKEAGLSSADVLRKIENNSRELSIITPVLDQFLPTKISESGARVLADELSKTNTELGTLYASAINDCIDLGKLADIKSKILTKDEEGKSVFRESKYETKLKAVAEVYGQYQQELWNRGLFDFDDMIIHVKETLENNAELRAEVEETYQYILVDEFQDTNNAQLSLITSMTSNPVHEGRPNVFVVGDDDQSIYKFQGAELSNIFNFTKLYRDVERIVLTGNYRSTQSILDFAHAVIGQGEDRLSKRDSTLIKNLVAKNETLKDGEISCNRFDTKEQELLFVAEEIKRLIESGVNPDDIAVISRKHKELQQALPYLDSTRVAYNYERKESVFDQKHISELVTICAFLKTVSSEKIEENDGLLAEILSFEFLHIDRVVVWEISRKAYANRTSWIEEMLASEHGEMRELARFFIELSVLAKTVPLEIILDLIIGSREMMLTHDEYDDDHKKHVSLPKVNSAFVSKYKDTYFGNDVIDGDIASYVHFLSSLRVFIFALREYKKGEKLLVADLSNFIKLHKEYNIALLNKTAFAGNTAAVHLMTAHKAKGLEFEYVFVIGCENSTWQKSSRSSRLPLPKNMPYTRALDTSDDFLRLFFVALTRAKHTIYMSYTDSILSYIADLESKDSVKALTPSVSNDSLLSGLSVYHIPPFAHDEETLLKKALDGYLLSPTHLTNFLNVTEGGPKRFLEQNLLRFPQSKHGSAVYGTAMHKAIEMMYVAAKRDGKNMSLDEVVAIFTHEMRKGRLLVEEEADFTTKGTERLKNFYSQKGGQVLREAANTKTEVDFRGQHVEYNGALLTGKIDRLVIDDETAKVVDMKTGKSFKSFSYSKTKDDDYENIKRHNYMMQLMVYRLLLEKSRDFGKFAVDGGVLEFVDTDDVDELALDFTSISDEEYLRFKKLVVAVYTKITNLDFPSIDGYEKNVEGILAFENDLVEGRI